MKLFKRLFPTRGGTRIWILLDPDNRPVWELEEIAAQAKSAGAHAILVGGSFIANDGFDECVRRIKESTGLPVIIFPGGSHQVSRHADGILFMSLLSGRNPQYLVGEQLLAAPIIRKYGLETIPTAYLLIESGRGTAVEFVSDTRPIPRDKPELAAVHSLTAELFGMQAVYLEAGSGAQMQVPVEMVRRVRDTVSCALIVGGGIRSPEEAKGIAEAGADALVIGTAVESGGLNVVRKMAKALTGLSG